VNSRQLYWLERDRLKTSLSTLLPRMSCAVICVGARLCYTRLPYLTAWLRRYAKLSERKWYTNLNDVFDRVELHFHLTTRSPKSVLGPSLF
jgi:hypothetical protein